MTQLANHLPLLYYDLPPHPECSAPSDRFVALPAPLLLDRLPGADGGPDLIGASPGLPTTTMIMAEYLLIHPLMVRAGEEFPYREYPENKKADAILLDDIGFP